MSIYRDITIALLMSKHKWHKVPTMGAILNRKLGRKQETKGAKSCLIFCFISEIFYWQEMSELREWIKSPRVGFQQGMLSISTVASVTPCDFKPLDPFIQFTRAGGGCVANSGLQNSAPSNMIGWTRISNVKHLFNPGLRMPAKSENDNLGHINNLVVFWFLPFKCH